MRSGTQILIATFVILSVGCDRKESLSLDDFVPVTISEIVSNESAYIGKTVTVEGYVLGLEIREGKNDGEVWVMVLSDKPFSGDTPPERLIFPQVKNKIRAGEDGYNSEILERCFKICNNARDNRSIVKVFGTFAPTHAFSYYNSGIDLHLNAVEINGVLINTDYNDHGVIKQKTPTVMRGLYKGGKKLSEVLKKTVL